MAYPKLKQLSELEQHHQDITALFDMAEELVATVESKFASDPNAQLLIVESLATEVADAADILSEEFIAVVEAHDKPKTGRKRVEMAFRKIFSAISDYNARVKAVAKVNASTIKNIADPIVEKIKRHAEQLVAIFVDFVDLSLERIMHKSEIDELRQRDAKIALMLHQLGHS